MQRVCASNIVKFLVMKMYKVISLHVRDSEGNRTEVSNQSVREFGFLRFRVDHAKVRRQVQCIQTSYLQQVSLITDILKTKHEKIGINSPFLEKYLITEQPVFRIFLRRFHLGVSIRSDLHLRKKVFFSQRRFPQFSSEFAHQDC